MEVAAYKVIERIFLELVSQLSTASACTVAEPRACVSQFCGELEALVVQTKAVATPVALRP